MILCSYTNMRSHAMSNRTLRIATVNDSHNIIDRFSINPTSLQLHRYYLICPQSMKRITLENG